MIRWKKRGDFPAIVRLVRKELIPISPHQHARGRKLFRQIRDRLRQGSTLIASEARTPDKPVAFLHLILHNGMLYVDLLAVDGKSQGHRWGTKLMRHAENYGRRNGCTLAKLFVDEDNVRGIRFYERLGYATVSHVEALACYEMMKPLGSAAPSTL